MPKFTILLAVTRPPIFLPCSVESVLSQTITEFELLIICDGAPAETIACAQEYARRDPRVKVLIRSKGERIGETHWHEALMSASGRYVAHIEDDDLWFPNYLSELEVLLQTADFGNLLHVIGYPDGSFHTLPSDLAMPAFRQRMLDKKFNRFGFSVCGYRMEAYRRLPDGWTPSPRGMWSDLHMWRKFLRRDDFRIGTRKVATCIVLPGHLRKSMPLEERERECRNWLNRINDDGERAKIAEGALRSSRVTWLNMRTARRWRDTTLREAAKAIRNRVLPRRR